MQLGFGCLAFAMRLLIRPLSSHQWSSHLDLRWVVYYEPLTGLLEGNYHAMKYRKTTFRLYYNLHCLYVRKMAIQRQ